jgi:hypothetical protein
MALRECASIGSLRGSYLQQGFRESLEPFGSTTNYCDFLFKLQRKLLRREVAWILYDEKETFQTRVGLLFPGLCARFPIRDRS